MSVYPDQTPYPPGNPHPPAPGGFFAPPPPDQSGFYPPPIHQQPMGQGFQPGPYHQEPPGGMAPPPNMAPPPMMKPQNCPPGLEYLTQVNHLIVKQKVELLEVITGFETNNKYVIKNSLGQQVYKAKEDTDCCTRFCCGPIRPFDLIIRDNFEKEVIHLYRPFRCQSACFPCCLQVLEVSSPPGNVIGTVEQDWTLCLPQFSIKNANGEVVLKIEGPFCTYSICGDVEFTVLSADGSTEVGKISKQWSGLLREAFTDADNFGITFPMDLDVRMKATLLGALFLIDFMFFEKSGNDEDDGIGML